MMEMELWSREPIGDKTFEEMRDSGEDNRTKSIVVEKVVVTLVGWERQKSVQSWLKRLLEAQVSADVDETSMLKSPHRIKFERFWWRMELTYSYRGWTSSQCWRSVVGTIVLGCTIGTRVNSRTISSRLGTSINQ